MANMDWITEENTPHGIYRMANNTRKRITVIETNDGEVQVIRHRSTGIRTDKIGVFGFWNEAVDFAETYDDVHTHRARGEYEASIR